MNVFRALDQIGSVDELSAAMHRHLSGALDGSLDVLHDETRTTALESLYLYWRGERPDQLPLFVGALKPLLGCESSDVVRENGFNLISALAPYLRSEDVQSLESACPFPDTTHDPQGESRALNAVGQAQLRARSSLKLGAFEAWVGFLRKTILGGCRKDADAARPALMIVLGHIRRLHRCLSTDDVLAVVNALMHSERRSEGSVAEWLYLEFFSRQLRPDAESSQIELINSIKQIRWPFMELTGTTFVDEIADGANQLLSHIDSESGLLAWDAAHEVEQFCQWLRRQAEVKFRTGIAADKIDATAMQVAATKDSRSRHSESRSSPLWLQPVAGPHLSKAA